MGNNNLKQQPVSEVNHNILSQPQPEEWSHVDKPDMDKLSKEICTHNCSCKSGDECHPDGALNYIELHESERSWKEDYDHENGQYVNRCHVCELYFVGHKRRVICKSCAVSVSKEPEEIAASFVNKMSKQQPIDPEIAKIVDANYFEMLSNEESEETIEKYYDKWCKENKKNGGFLYRSSVIDFVKYWQKQQEGK